MVSFALKDYFDKKVEEYRLRHSTDDIHGYRNRTRSSARNKTLQKSIQHQSNVIRSKADSMETEKKGSAAKTKIITTKEQIDALITSWISANNGIKDKWVAKAKMRIKLPELKSYLETKVNHYRIGRSHRSIIKGSTIPESKHSTVNRNNIKEDPYIPSGAHGGKKPKYGYARDIFGRIQERDHYVEGKKVNPYNSSSSLYDRNDDNDSMYEGFD